MSKDTLNVYVDLEGNLHLVGKLWHHYKDGRESASFAYADDWLSSPQRFALEPLLQLTKGSFHTSVGKALFGAIGDSAPDRWGRVLMRRYAKEKALIEGKDIKTLTELDYLLMVSDEVRQGALRFKKELDGSFLAEPGKKIIPPLVDLPKLLSATEHFLKNEENYEELRLLLAPGASLGGARPKASVRDNQGKLLIAKFPHANDEHNTVLWEAVALRLAEEAGIKASKWQLEKIDGKDILLIERFDRKGTWRIPFLSAMSMLNAKDNEDHSYLEIVEVIRQYGAAPKKDMEELWRRIVFRTLISNTDDHLTNHGVLYEGGQGWCLSPLYDVDPVPVEIRPRILTTAIDLTDRRASLDVAFSAREAFGLNGEDAQKIAHEVGESVSQWREVASNLGIKKSEIISMASAFEHDDLKKALEN